MDRGGCRAAFVRERSFDLVSCVAAVPYLEDVGAAFTEWHRVLRPGGALVVTVVRDGGLTTFELLRRAALTAGVELAEPNAGLGLADPLRHATAQVRRWVLGRYVSSYRAAVAEGDGVPDLLFARWRRR